MIEGIEIGENYTVVIRKKLSSEPIVAKALGIEYAKGKPVKIYLDRLIHDESTTVIGAWSVEGAVSSILTLYQEVSRG